MLADLDPAWTILSVPGQVHVWSFDLDSVTLDPAHPEYLAADEMERAARFHFPRDRHRFLAGRIFAHQLLARYLHLPIGRLRWRYSAYGRPEIDNDAGIRCNWSHSGGRILIGFALGREIGVDIEYARLDVDFDSIARSFFAPGEQAQLSGMPPAARPDAYYRCWTRKEAYIKARGMGLSLPLADFEVSLAPAGPFELLRSCDPVELHRWSFFSIDTCPGFLAAAAVEKPCLAPRVLVF